MRKRENIRRKKQNFGPGRKSEKINLKKLNLYPLLMSKKRRRQKKVYKNFCLCNHKTWTPWAPANFSFNCKKRAD